MSEIMENRKMHVRAPQNLLFGLFMIAVGLLALALAWHLPMGSASQMGPGYMPKIIASLCIGIGVLIAALSLRVDGARLERFAWKPFVLVIGALVFFGLTVERLGLFLCLVATIGISMLAERTRLLPAVAFALLLAGFCVILFGVVLGIPIPLAPAF